MACALSSAVILIAPLSHDLGTSIRQRKMLFIPGEFVAPAICLAIALGVSIYHARRMKLEAASAPRAAKQEPPSSEGASGQAG
jgi:hypothetical protein